MTLDRPKKKNPQIRTRVPTLPPGARSRAALGMAVMAAQGKFALQHCDECGAVQYPPREACAACLSSALSWKGTEPYGKLLAETRIQASPDPYFRERLPWRMGSVRLEAGPVVLAHLVGVGRGDRVKMELRLDRAGQGVMVARPVERSEDMEDDPVLRAMGTHPKHRRILISDATQPVARPLIDALMAAGADHVFAGIPEMWRRPPGMAAVEGLENVSLVPLDVTDQQGLKDAASEIGGKVDILINTARHIRPGGVMGHDTTAARDEMEVNALGLMRLAQAFGPAMAGRTADGVNASAALITILSAHALSPDPAFGAFNASQAAARSVVQTLRAEFAGAGLRVMAVYTGPTDDEWHQPLPPPKVAPKALARAIVEGLQLGHEEVFCGDVARDLAERWQQNPALLEREITGGGA
ncbi:SDR family NAD(P)-dependent oxidoreductase [Lutimaribacter sp. EGI FJ00015]|uniref:SDR family NAD(P)-dependent oxidoreductase n=1 Tax=Lutimaribacter degradans TaxID=2945989 RepID=A0ACC5ZYI3_9RHOB|nr:SDR family NAD(P)-dependent oxidoreductase [Lutimaribacter sp. EGI FJ00013]MCM2563160.1 SDR family NAD(P)-dependent oxidoreductase [Lutimaribacter sp. EGI FJ00013]MCO0614339.1 SDR family NAD(P)-dependent oxidoreductase [Lutimaribacter sp. EGI FJ00015]MCO0637149.1 SDR family NAD(P)-dependent oxidoreductase [Lutimaribacter sp. EGI FJ00014]